MAINGEDRVGIDYPENALASYHRLRIESMTKKP